MDWNSCNAGIIPDCCGEVRAKLKDDTVTSYSTFNSHLWSWALKNEEEEVEFPTSSTEEVIFFVKFTCTYNL